MESCVSHIPFQTLVTKLFDYRMLSSSAYLRLTGFTWAFLNISVQFLIAYTILIYRFECQKHYNSPYLPRIVSELCQKYPELRQNHLELLSDRFSLSCMDGSETLPIVNGHIRRNVRRDPLIICALRYSLRANVPLQAS